MDRRNVARALLAVLAIAAIAAAAATLPSTTQSGSGGFAGGPPTSGSGDRGIIPPPDPMVEPLVDLPDLSALATFVAFLLLVLGLLYAALFRREMLRALAGFAVLMLVLLAFFWLASFVDLSATNVTAGAGPLFGEPAGSEGGQTTTTPQPLVLLVVVGVVVAGLVAVLVRSGAIDAPVGGTEPAEPTRDAVAVGEAAGRAADRIEETDDLDNEIYRAWREMTELLDVSHPESSTPGEFAAAAVEAGMDRDDVAGLTRLFEDVRYGGDDPTADAERRAVNILRRIEATYSPEDGDGG